MGVYLVGGYLLRVREDVSVPSERHGRALVAEHLRDDVYRYPRVEHHYGGRVAQVVEAADGKVVVSFGGQERTFVPEMAPLSKE